MRPFRLGAVALLLASQFALFACDDDDSPSGPGPSLATVRFEYRASTVPRTDLTPSQQACALAVGSTHIHPSWRNFARIDLTAGGPNLWQITFGDVPVNARQAIRVSDGNVCDENPTGAATRNVFANDVPLTEIVPTPGSGTEPGLAFTVNASGRVTP